MNLSRGWELLKAPLKRHPFDTTIFVDNQTELLIVAGVHVVYFMVYLMLKTFVFSGRQFYRDMKPPQRHEFISYCISMINSALQSICVLFLYYWYWFDTAAYARWIRSWDVYFAGYMLYDFFSSCAYGAYVFKKEKGLVPHHLVVFLSLVRRSTTTHARCSVKSSQPCAK